LVFKKGKIYDFLNKLRKDPKYKRTNNWRLMRETRNLMEPGKPDYDFLHRFSREEAIYIKNLGSDLSNSVAMLNNDRLRLIRNLPVEIQDEIKIYADDIYNMASVNGKIEIVPRENPPVDKNETIKPDVDNVETIKPQVDNVETIEQPIKEPIEPIEDGNVETIQPTEDGNVHKEGGKKRKTKSRRTKKSNSKHKRKTRNKRK